MIVFIRGETLSAQSASPRKIHGWIVLVRENFSVNKRAKENKQLKLQEVGFSLFPFSYFAFGSSRLSSKKLKIHQYNF